MTGDADVLIVGAGLAGLRAAQVLGAAGRHVILVDAADRVGGRVRSDLVDGFIIDRGFQLLNTSYPELSRAVDLSALRLRPFERAVIMREGGRDHVLADPRQHPGDLFSTMRAWPGTPMDLVRAARLLLGVSGRRVDGNDASTDRSTEAALSSLGFSRRAIEDLWRPFLSGVLLRDDLATSWRFSQLVLRSFVRGQAAVPLTGASCLPDTMASSLANVELRLGTRVTKVDRHHVDTSWGVLCADHVIVATDATNASLLLPRLSVPASNGVSTWWFAAPRLGGPARLRLDLDERRLVNALEITAAAPAYAPSNSSVIAASALTLRHLEDTRVRDDVARLFALTSSDLRLIARSDVPGALPDLRSPLALRRDIDIEGVVVAGDWTETPSVQGALVSGRRAADRVVRGHVSA